MKRCFLLTIGLLVLLLAFGCSEKKSEWKTFSNGIVEFSYPTTWQIIDQQKIDLKPKPEVLIQAPTADEGFIANINMIIQMSPMLAPSAKDQADQNIELLKIMSKSYGIKDYKQIDFSPLKIGNVEAGILTSEFTISQNNITVKNNQLIVPKGQKTYFLTLTSRKEKWETYEPIFKNILSSFKLLE